MGSPFHFYIMRGLRRGKVSILKMGSNDCQQFNSYALCENTELMIIECVFLRTCRFTRLYASFFIGNYLLVSHSVIQDLATLLCCAWPVIVYITIRAWYTDFSQARDFPCSFERSPFLRARATGLVSIWPTSPRGTFETLFPRNFLPSIVTLSISNR